MNKFTLITLCAVFGVALSASVLPRDIFEDWEGRIVGGSTAGVGQFPYQVSLRTAGNAHFCGGWVTNNRWAVSAAHCTIGRTTANTRVVVGAHSRTDGTSHTTSAIRNHPNYNANTLNNDISTVQTAAAIGFNARVSAIPLGAATLGGNVAAVVSGWGQTSHPGSGSANLMFLNTRTLTNADCQARHTANNRPMVFASTICTFTQNGQGNCMGDSGGPLVAGGQAIGAVSWGIACARGFPDVYARVSSHRTWILNNS